jgi:hypothetical protein
VILSRQFRYPAFVNGYDDLLIEVPAGLLHNAAPEDRIRAEAAGRPAFTWARSGGCLTPS